MDAFLEVLDIEYAYRLCAEAGLTGAFIWLRGAMHKYEEAVEAALSIKDVELAKFYAAKPEDGRGRRGGCGVVGADARWLWHVDH